MDHRQVTGSTPAVRRALSSDPAPAPLQVPPEPYPLASSKSCRESIDFRTVTVSVTRLVSPRWPGRRVTTASRICPAAAMSSCPVAASAITWCDSGPWWRRARSGLCTAGTDAVGSADGTRKWSFCTLGGATRARPSPGRWNMRNRRHPAGRALPWHACRPAGRGRARQLRAGRRQRAAVLMPRRRGRMPRPCCVPSTRLISDKEDVSELERYVVDCWAEARAPHRGDDLVMQGATCKEFLTMHPHVDCSRRRQDGASGL